MFTIFLQQILNNKLLQTIIDSKNIILVINIVNVALLKIKNKEKSNTHKIHNIFFTIVKLANFY